MSTPEFKNEPSKVHQNNLWSLYFCLFRSGLSVVEHGTWELRHILKSLLQGENETGDWYF